MKGITDFANQYIYTYVCHETERDLCQMEIRSLFGKDVDTSTYILSSKEINPSRSAFISMRLNVSYALSSLDQLCDRLGQVEIGDATFKVVYMKAGDPFTYEEQRSLERKTGACINGTANMRSPDVRFGLMAIQGIWVWGECQSPPESIRLKHKDKPQNYSTGLPVHVARALVNIVIPDAIKVRAIDPCCGMGNVLIEALSMGIDMVGCDINPLAVKGARVNLAHFGYPDVVKLGDMNNLVEEYDAAILDMPYNLCSVISEEDQLRMLRSLRRLSKRAIIVSTLSVQHLVEQAGFRVIDQCIVSKGSFVRNVWLGE